MSKVTKKELAKNLYLQNHHLERKELISLVMKELNTTENSARTHISNAAKVLNPTLGKQFMTRKSLNPSLKKVQAERIVLANYKNMTRKELANKLITELNVKTLNSANTHISSIIKEHNLTNN